MILQVVGIVWALISPGCSQCDDINISDVATLYLTYVGPPHDYKQVVDRHYPLIPVVAFVKTSHVPAMLDNLVDVNEAARG